jgi:hypothetical protein
VSHDHRASGGYHFLIPADFNGGIFGGAFNYEQTDFGAGGGVPHAGVAKLP